MTAQISVDKIKELRDITGVGMGKCKEALQQSAGDIDKAVKYLRETGVAQAVKKEGRSANEGTIVSMEDKDSLCLVEVNAETDFVVQNDKFKEVASNIASDALKSRPKDLESFLAQPYSKDPSLTIDQYRAMAVQMIGENIQIRRLLTLLKNENSSFGLYSHMGGKLVTVVELTGSNKEADFAKSIAMHVAAASPEYLSPDFVPQEIIDSEKAIARKQMEGKPENIVEKILEGKIKAYFDAVCLLNQKYIKDDSLSIAELVEKRAKETGSEIKIARFFRFAVGQ